MKVSTQWLKDFVKLTPPLERIAERLTMAGLEVKKVEKIDDLKDTIFEVEVTTNRPDWLSHIGVGREIAAVENLSLNIPDIQLPSNRAMPAGWKLSLKEAEGCPYYTGVYIEGIEGVQTPPFMKERLMACGLRSISLLVDITNYVLLETGQPLHAFDADLLKGKEIQIRRAKVEENFTAINGSAIILKQQDLVIADGEKTIALAGVMGGLDTEVNERTRNIILESAYFHPRWVRQTSLRYGLTSESSYRFERGVDPEGVDYGRERALDLIKQYAKPRFISGVLKAGQRPTVSKSRIHLSLAQIESCLGMTLKSHQVASSLTRLGLDVKKDSQDKWNVKIPSFRSDLSRPIDLIEEVARIYGYDQIPETLPAREALHASENPRLKVQEKTRAFFTGNGFSETVTFSLISEQGLDAQEDLNQAVSIINPQHQELCWMRPVMAPSLLTVIRKNDHLGARRIAIYEIANLYAVPKGANHPCEEKTLGLAVCGTWREKSWLDAQREITFHDLKGMITAYLNVLGIEPISYVPARKSFLKDSMAEQVLIDGGKIGFLGEINEKIRNLWDLDRPVFVAELSLERIFKFVRWIRPVKELPRYPAIERDFSITVRETCKSGDIESEIWSHGQGLICRVELFDLFRGGRVPKGCKNLAYRVTYQSPERTLISEEIQELHMGIAEKIVNKFQATFQDGKS
ncbi:MAG: phenylalanine--tRNA ligase subunit beta [Candidatus Omnitrophica bacterium]|nr:phenylalanine--tRNA ligase subunit beta [Candidatus Omnitrophota bacterium]